MTSDVLKAIDLNGSLSEFPLADIFQLLLLTGKTGELRLSREGAGPSVSIFFDAGKILHASDGVLEGRAVIDRTLRWTEGRFEFRPGNKPTHLSINAPAQTVLLDALTRFDDMMRIERELPPPTIKLSLSAVVREVPPITSTEWRFLAFVNGRRTVKAICDLGGDEYDAKTALASLLRKGLITSASPEQQWHGYVPLVIPAAEIDRERPFPPRLRTNLLLKSIDGTASLGTLFRAVLSSEEEFLEDVRFLRETGWITFDRADTAYF